jgi:glycerol-3-phosphate dehydrogenase
VSDVPRSSRPAPRRRTVRGPGGGSEGFGRADALARLADTAFDVLVIGGGITGAGVALDAASRGLRTALVEKDDFASGTSSKSSKMIHGGLRYLQQREIRLVYENLAERQRLLTNAPHLVTPLPFLIPLFGRDGVVSKTMARSYSSALRLYDVTGGFRIGSRHRSISASEALAHLPGLDTSHLVAGFLYFDARADDARLTLTIVRTAVLEHGAVAANHATAEAFLTDRAGRVIGARVRPGDGEGSPSGGTEPIEVHARAVVNATGVWADQVRDLDERSHAHSIRPAKGIHVTVPRDRLPTDIAAVIPVPKDRRSIFVVPWPEADLVYLGTTDTDYDGPLDDPACTPDDVDYLLDAANGVTRAGLTRADVTGVWAGLRPLLAPGDHHVSARTADLSRRHSVRTSANGVVTVTGGKLTTYRKMAEDTVDEVARRLGGPSTFRRCVTRRLSLLGAPRSGDSGSASLQLAAEHPGIDHATIAHLLSRYGTEAHDVLAVAATRDDLLDPVVPGLPYLGAEIVHAVRAEMALGVDDVLARRTRALIMRARETAAAAPAVAALVAEEWGWDAETAAEEARQFAGRALAALAAAGLPAVGPPVTPPPEPAARRP